jgi:prepilin-type processing-associated H-X9-DG protein
MIDLVWLSSGHLMNDSDSGLILEADTAFICFDVSGRGIYHQIPTFRECPSRNGYFAQSLRRIRILTLEILKYIPALKILILLGLERNILFLDGH